MKIEWLNAERTKARLTMGWFSKRFTDVFQDNKDVDKWGYEIDNRLIDSSLAAKINRARRWQRAGKLPVAKALPT